MNNLCSLETQKQTKKFSNSRIHFNFISRCKIAKVAINIQLHLYECNKNQVTIFTKKKKKNQATITIVNQNKFTKTNKKINQSKSFQS